LDPENSRIRWALVISRRVYQVRAPNSLWHIDGHHSLVTWGFVIHGDIDSFSRMVTYLHCSTNNYSETVVRLFQEAVLHYGTPLRVRSDHGGENVLVWNFMEESRGYNRGSAIKRTSTQNQRIERLWRDVFRSVCCTYYYLFHVLELNGILNRNDRNHMLILHYIFLPRINKTLESFCLAWNDHPIRTERNWTPNRLWLNGMIDIRNRNLCTVQDVLHNEEFANADDLEWYGYDADAPAPENNDLPQVEVDDIDDIPDALTLQLREIDPLQPSNSLGIDIFITALNLL